ncbi:MAG: GGDEF domain-containing protein [Methylovulum sp.]|nr:GGDEF domain-containing protein [Methylovulum sp.]
MTRQTISVQQCFSWATEITRCQDYQTLTRVFLDLLKSLNGINSAFAYEIYGDRKKRTQPYHTSEEILIRKLPLDFAADRGEDSCPLLNNKPLPSHIEIVISGETTQAILPVVTDTGPDRAIVLEGIFNDETVTLLNNLLRLYHNQVILHDHRERDMLTRLPNRQSFDARLMEICEFYQHAELIDKTDGKLSWIAMLDIDHFKAVNDNFGHLYGDEVLLHFSQLMEGKFRYIDFIFRFGGEEFVVILNKANKSEAENSFNRFRMAVENFDFPLVGKITVSIGVTCIQDHNILPVTLLDRADKALYFAKDKGRNQVVLYEGIINLQSAANHHNDIELF